MSDFSSQGTNPVGMLDLVNATKDNALNTGELVRAFNALASAIRSTTPIYSGSGAPSISATQGALYLRTDGNSTSTRVYVNTNGSTGWTNLVSAT